LRRDAQTATTQLDLSGENTTLGHLVLNAFSGGSDAGVVSLTKSLEPGAIVWTGSLQGSGGEARQLSISRARTGGDGSAAPTSPRTLSADTTYSGALGQAACKVGLTWGGNDSLSGYLEAGGTTYTVTGDNATQGQINLTLKAPTGETMTATLTKSIDGTTLLWSGTLRLPDGSTTSLSFSRPR
jgi:hypothetical protein